MYSTHPKPTLRLMLGATGVVLGDIGTSRLYAFRESFIDHHCAARYLPCSGALSMLVRELILVVTVTYVFVTMRADNRGEGGSFALLTLIQRIAKRSPALSWIAGAALAATALFYGDAIIGPAISILSAVEGLTLLGPTLSELVIPVTLAIIVGLFTIQRFGAHIVGTLTP